MASENKIQEKKLLVVYPNPKNYEFTKGVRNNDNFLDRKCREKEGRRKGRKEKGKRKEGKKGVRRWIENKEGKEEKKECKFFLAGKKM